METFTSQVAPAARTPPERLMILVPGIAPKVPPQVLVRLGGLATSNPAGRLSVKLRPVSWIPELLVIVKLRVTGTPTEVVEGLKLLVNVGAAKGPGGKPTMLGEGLGVGRGGIVGADTGGGTRGLG
ncbi:hypothetical protein NW848_16640 [Synechococcus sp. RC10A2]